MNVEESSAQWVASLEVPSIVNPFLAALSEFTGSKSLVVTMLGAYDTGKSSLLRRLLVDSGSTVPEWLTISARQETYTVNSAVVDDYLVRDTPGLYGAGDPRSVANTAAALMAAQTTDVLLLVVNPQGATSEREILRSVLEWGWVPPSLILISSRFDESGVDPTLDPDEFEQARLQKSVEIRHSLLLSATTPIHVVAQDYGQMAGSKRNPAPDVWDQTRKWDGIAALRDELEAIRSDREALRKEGHRRFWRVLISRLRDGLAQERNHLDIDQAVASTGTQRRAQWLAEVEAVKGSAERDLDGAVETIVTSTIRSGALDEAVLKSAIDSQIETWWNRNTRALERVAESLEIELENRQKRPGWQEFESLWAALSTTVPNGSSSDPTTNSHYDATAEWGEFGTKLLTELRGYVEKSAGMKIEDINKKTASGSKMGTVAEKAAHYRLANGIQLAEFGLPLLIQAVGMWNQSKDAQEEEAAREASRKTVEDESRRIATEVAASVYERWLPVADTICSAIIYSTDVQVAADGAIGEAIKKLDVNIARAEKLLQELRKPQG